MNNIKVCRTCLSLEGKLVNLNSQPLHNYYQILMAKSVFWDPIPATVCTKCMSMFMKFNKFREQCINSEGLLNALLCSNEKLTVKDIQNNRNSLYPSYNLSVETLESVNIVSNIEDKIDVEAKIEPEVDIKVEANFDDYYPLSSDDEPLSLHRSLKEEQESKKEKKKKKKGESRREVPVVLNDEPAPKKVKSGRPKKAREPVEPKKPTRRTTNTGGVCNDDMDLETFCNIVQLTLEEQIAEVSKRQHSANYKGAMFQCNLCYKGFIDDEAWKHHLQKHSLSAGDMECPVCKIRFRTKRTLQKHSSNHEKKYECKACDYVSQTTTQAKQHQRWHKGVTYKCQYCEEVSTKWTSYLSHVRMKHPSEHVCATCGYSFVSRLGLTMHRTMMHKDLKDQDKSETADGGESTYCAECDLKFDSAQAWKRHMVTSIKHTQSRDFKLNNGCKVCGERFADAEQLRVHHRRAHARARPKNYGKPRNQRNWPAKCTHCPEEIQNARDYWTHFRREHPDKNYPIPKNYVCDVCGKSFRGNAFLVYHKRTHSGERGFKCPLCPKAFFNRYNLQMHEKTHSENRPHPCTVCFKAFKSKGALDRHFRCHTGEKPYACEVCGKAFAQSNSRKLHVRTVHLKQPSPYLSRSRQERRKCAAAALQHKDAHY